MNKYILLAIFLFPWFVLPVRGVEPASYIQTGVSVRQTTQAKRQEVKQLRCQINETKLKNRIDLTESMRDKHYTAIQNIRKNVEQFLIRSEKNNCDTEIVKKDLVTLDGLVEKFAAAFRDWKSSMQGVSTVKCDKSNSAMTTSIEATKTKFEVMKSTAEAVRSFTQSTLKSDYIAAMKACKLNKPSPIPDLKGNQ